MFRELNAKHERINDKNEQPITIIWTKFFFVSEIYKYEEIFMKK